MSSVLPVIPLPQAVALELAAELSNALVRDGFGTRSYLRGPDIPDFSPHPQVNRLVLLHVAEALQTHVANLRHPYFDHTHAEVRAARAALERTLSHHIRIEKHEFRALLERALADAIRLLTDPHDALDALLFGSAATLAPADLQRMLGYLVYYEGALQAVAQHAAAHGQAYTRTAFHDKFARAALLHAEASGTPLADYREQAFRALTGEGFPAPAPAPVPAPAASANGRIPDRSLTLEGIPLHRQFVFVQRLFGGDNQRFRLALDQVNAAPSYAAALRQLEAQVLNPELQLREAEVVSEFLDLVKTRF